MQGGMMSLLKHAQQTQAHMLSLRGNQHTGMTHLSRLMLPLALPTLVLPLKRCMTVPR